jgi:serine/threonine-protein kinase
MSSPVQPGDVLADKYRVDRVLGVGGMGVVVAATHLQLDQVVALKFMLPEVLKDAAAVSRFLREAKAVVRLKGEHIAHVLDVGTLANGAPYIVMEYLAGSDLADVLDKQGRLPIEDACQYVLEACEGMAEAHALGIIHRDLKPQNLFLTQRPDGTSVVKVLDFGISKSNVAETSAAHATQTSAMMGSPAYMSPEQIHSAKDVDARTDIWALGVILYQLVSGRLPFNAERLMEMCVQVLSSEPAPLRELRTDAPPELEQVVARCLHKQREQRYANMAELAAALARFVPSAGMQSVERVSRLLKVTPRAPAEPKPAAPSLPAESKPVAPSVRADRGFDTTLGSAASVSLGPLRSGGGKRRVFLATAIASLAAVAVTIGVVSTRGGGSRDPDVPPPAPPTATTQPASTPIMDAQPPPADATAMTAEIDAGTTAPVTSSESPKRPSPTPASTVPKRVVPRPTAAVAPSPVPVPIAQPAAPPPPNVPPTATPTQPVQPAGTPPPKRDPFSTRH